MSLKLRADLLQWTGDLDALMNGRQVCAFFGGISKMTLLRWVQNPASWAWVSGSLSRSLKSPGACGHALMPACLMGS